MRDEEVFCQHWDKRAFDIDFNHVLFWNIIDYTYPLLAKDIEDNPMTLSKLRDKIKAIDQAYVKNKELVNVVRGFECPVGQLQLLISLSEVLESAGKKCKSQPLL